MVCSQTRFGLLSLGLLVKVNRGDKRRLGERVAVLRAIRKARRSGLLGLWVGCLGRVRIGQQGRGFLGSLGLAYGQSGEVVQGNVSRQVSTEE